VEVPFTEDKQILQAVLWKLYLVF